MMIRRTALANRPRANGDAYWGEYWGGPGVQTAAYLHEGDFPTHSPLLGPDGAHLQYEPRDPIGFDLRSKK